LNRLALLFAFSFAFGSLGVQWAAAQAQPAAPQAPFSPRLPSTVVASTSSVAVPKPTATQAVRPAVRGSSQAAKEPEQMKVLRLYRGAGFFDAGLAEKLRPVLTKEFAVTTEKNGSASSNLLQSVLARYDGSEKSVDQNRVIKTGQP
jgi:hypothetical protein